MGRDRLRTPTCTSCRSRQKASREGEHRIQIQYHLRRNGRSEILATTNSYLGGRLAKSRCAWRGAVSRTSDATNFIQHIVDKLLANGVVTSSVVVGSILFATDQELRVKELSVLTSANFINRRRVEIDKDGARDMFVIACLVEEGLERSGVTDVRVRVRATISLQAVLEEVPGGQKLVFKLEMAK